ncbi:MAG: CDP-alcohol phosphatidyltransferase family protein [Candidatus Omnitrophota bacterium]
MEKERVPSLRERFEYDKALKTNRDSFMERIQFADKYLNRPMASVIARAVFHTPVTPNGLTYFSCIVGLSGAYFFTRATHLDFILGGILAQLCSILDGADGMLARAKNMCTRYGSNLDLFLDRVIDFFVLVGISVGAYFHYKNPTLTFLGTLSAGLYLLQIHMFYLTKDFLQLNEKGDNGEARALLFWAIMIFGMINRLDIFIYALLAVTITVNIARLIYFINLRTKY